MNGLEFLIILGAGVLAGIFIGDWIRSGDTQALRDHYVARRDRWDDRL